MMHLFPRLQMQSKTSIWAFLDLRRTAPRCFVWYECSIHGFSYLEHLWKWSPWSNWLWLLTRTETQFNWVESLRPQHTSNIFSGQFCWVINEESAKVKPTGPNLHRFEFLKLWSNTLWLWLIRAYSPTIQKIKKLKN